MALGLFKPQTDGSENMATPDVQEDRLDHELSQEGKARAEDLMQFNSELIHVDKIQRGSESSVYHELITKESKTSWINRDERDLLMLWRAMLDLELYFKLEENPLMTHAELTDFLATSSSIDGNERKALISSILKTDKTIGLAGEKKKLL